jgi:hypothetical protein
MIRLMEAESVDATITRLARELAHVNQQCQVAHRMATAWRAKYRACEQERAYLAKKLAPKGAQEANRRHEEKQADVHARFGLFLDDPVDEGTPTAEDSSVTGDA